MGHAWDSILSHAAISEELLRAIDEGRPAGDTARTLALEVLRTLPADSVPWQRAVAFLEGGALRMRHAVELAGAVLDAVAAAKGDVRTG